MEQDKARALFIARKVFAEVVFDVQKLEGLPFTLPEVQTYLQGVTVGGHKVTDEDKLRRQIAGWTALLDLVEAERFALDKATACALQAVIAEGEALETGRFRSGMVGIAGTDYAPPRPEELDRLFAAMLQDVLRLSDVRLQAYRLHLDVARNQFFYDGNKRTGLLLCNGRLLSHGFPPLSIPAKRLVEYNAGMLRFYDSGDPAEMSAFLGGCHEAMYRRFA